MLRQTLRELPRRTEGATIIEYAIVLPVLLLVLACWLLDTGVRGALLVSALGVLGWLVSSHGYAWLLAAITVDIVLMALLGDPSSALGVAANRTAEVILIRLSSD